MMENRNNNWVEVKRKGSIGSETDRTDSTALSGPHMSGVYSTVDAGADRLKLVCTKTISILQQSLTSSSKRPHHFPRDL